MVSSNYFTKFHDFSMIIQLFFKFHDFSMHGAFFLDFPGLPYFPELVGTLFVNLLNSLPKEIKFKACLINSIIYLDPLYKMWMHR